MVEVKKVKNKREMKKFVRFPTELYKDNPIMFHQLNLMN